MTKKYKPRSAVIAVTYKCNSRCQMCNIWQMDNPSELALEVFDNLSPDIHYLNISGGEPFLRADLPEIVSVINKRAPKAEIIISSNGLATELIRSHMEKIHKIDPRVGVRISLDGLGVMHDEVRGVPGAYEAVMKTMAELEKIGISNLGFGFTIMDKNVHHVKDVYLLSRKMGVELALAVVQNSDFYFKKLDNRVTYLDEMERGVDYVIDSELGTWNPKRWARAFFNYGLKYYARNDKRVLKSGAGFDSLFIDPQGDIFPSNLINLKIGNIKDGRLDEVWQSEQANEVRRKILDDKIVESWMICTLRSEMKRNLHKVAYWMIKNKIRVMKTRLAKN